MDIWSAVQKIWPIKRPQELVDAIFEELKGIRVEQGRLEAMIHQCSLRLDQCFQRLELSEQPIFADLRGLDESIGSVRALLLPENLPRDEVDYDVVIRR